MAASFGQSRSLMRAAVGPSTSIAIVFVLGDSCRRFKMAASLTRTITARSTLTSAPFFAHRSIALATDGGNGLPAACDRYSIALAGVIFCDCARINDDGVSR